MILFARVGNPRPGVRDAAKHIVSYNLFKTITYLFCAAIFARLASAFRHLSKNTIEVIKVIINPRKSNSVKPNIGLTAILGSNGCDIPVTSVQIISYSHSNSFESEIWF